MRGLRTHIIVAVSFLLTNSQYQESFILENDKTTSHLVLCLATTLFNVLWRFVDAAGNGFLTAMLWEIEDKNHQFKFYLTKTISCQEKKDLCKLPTSCNNSTLLPVHLLYHLLKWLVGCMADLLQLEQMKKKSAVYNCIYSLHAPVITQNIVFNHTGPKDVKFLSNTLKKTLSTGKFQRSGNIGLKSAEFIEASDSILTLTHSEGQHSRLHLRGSKLQKMNL